jgi:hypothetical protein
MSRKRFSEREVLETLIVQGVLLRCYRCKKPMMLPADIEREHLVEIALGGLDVPRNCVYSHAACHAIITDGTKATTAGSSKQRIAKVRRILADKPSRNPMKKTGRKIPSRPFPKARAK